MEVAVKSVHIGEAIEKRRLELDISKSELGRRIGVSQQHVNRILKRDTMESKKLVDLCHALDLLLLPQYRLFSSPVRSHYGNIPYGYS